MTTDEQRAADQQLHEAITRACTAHGWDEGGATLAEYVVVGVLAENEPTEQRVHTRYFTLLTDNHMPQHHVLGLLAQAQHWHQG